MRRTTETAICAALLGLLIVEIAPQVILPGWAQGKGKAQSANARAKAEIRAVLEAQDAAWDRGDIERFMEGYWKLEKTVFVSTNGVNRGWQALLERYRRNYPDRKAMGKLSFTDLEITMLGPDSAVVLGWWRLEREKDRPGGVFTLVVRKFPEGWKIIHDHTSTVAEK